MAKNDIWTTKTGKKMKMCDMSDSHLYNSIIYFQSKVVRTKSKRWKNLKCEARRRKWKIIDSKDEGIKIITDPSEDEIQSRFDILDLRDE